MALTACRKDETLSAYGASGEIWVLAELNGNAFTSKATVEFPEPGKIRGQAPCNSFAGIQTAPYPWFSAKDVLATRMACSDLTAEQAFLDALSAMSLSEVSGGTLILSNESGGEMLFRAADNDG